MTDVTNLKTITFDPAKYKLVPVDQSSQQQEVGIEAIYLDMTAMNKQFTANRVYRHMVAVVPDQLQGVVEHSGEPVAWDCNGYPFTDYAHAVAFAQANMFQMIPLFTHPAPSQPSDEVYWILRSLLQDELVPESEFNSVDFDAVYGRYSIEELALDLKKRVEAIQSNQEALVQAALEAAAKLCDNHAKLSSCVIDQHLYTAARCIRTIDKQKIIKEASK